MDKRAAGKLGENMAEEFYISNGYRILRRNFRAGSYEIDVIAEKDNVLAFCEVKLRTGADYGGAEHAVLRKKQKRVSECAAAYLTQNGGFEKDIRFDVIAVNYIAGEYALTHYPAAFDFCE